MQIIRMYSIEDTITLIIIIVCSVYFAIFVPASLFCDFMTWLEKRQERKLASWLSHDKIILTEKCGTCKAAGFTPNFYYRLVKTIRIKHLNLIYRTQCNLHNRYSVLIVDDSLESPDAIIIPVYVENTTSNINNATTTAICFEYKNEVYQGYYILKNRSI